MPSEPPSTQVKARARHIYLLFLMGMTFINFGRNSIAIIFPQYLALSPGPGLDSQTLSFVVNAQSLAIFVFGWSMGFLCRKLGDGRTLLAGALFAVVGLLLVFLYSSLPIFYLSSFLRGVADVLLLSSAYAYASRLVPASIRARGLAGFNATFFLSWGWGATFLSGPMIDALIRLGYAQATAYRFSFAAGASLTMIGLMVEMWLMFIVSRRDRNRNALPRASA